MTHDDAEAFATLMEGLNTAFPRQALTETAQAKVYFPALRDLSIAEVTRGVESAIRYATFMPSPGEIRHRVTGSTEDRAVLAWPRVRHAAMAGYGYYRDLDFGDPIIHAAVIAMGGWRVLYSHGFRDTESVEWVTARREFLQLYSVYDRLGAPADTPNALPAVDHDSTREPVRMPPGPAVIEHTVSAALPPAASPENFTPTAEAFQQVVADIVARARLKGPSA
jgi:hypothetical protein